MPKVSKESAAQVRITAASRTARGARRLHRELREFRREIDQRRCCRGFRATAARARTGAT